MSVAPFVVCVLAATLYARGGRGRRRIGREVSFYAGVLVALAAVEPPFDGWADRSFAIHMTQHVVLMTVVPPLLVLGRPWPRLWLPFPLRLRRSVGRALADSAVFRRVGSVAVRPSAALALMSVSLAAWHVPAMYDAAVRSEAVHTLEHVCFVGTSLLWWGALLEAPPVRARIDHLRRAAWFAAGMLPSWTLAVVLGFASSPLYGAYASLPHRVGGLSAIADQQLAAGVMWVPGSLTSTVAFVLAIYRWLEPDPVRIGVEPRAEELSWT